MPRINILEKSVAELIAAGEVVERPASVVKELVENSVDAGASSVVIEIRDGGTNFIRVTDNGCGISREDVPKAFVSHATSKVRTENDLNSIFTLGFRGEALPSICAVSRLQMLTKTADEELGTNYVIEGGIEKSISEAGCPNGTTVIVRNIFFNTPARMKFLKKPVSEGNAVADIVDKLALSHPEISFRFIRDDKQIILTPGDGNILSCVYSVFGASFAKTLIEADGEINGISVTGLVSKPIESRPTRAMQFFFINGRFVKSRSLSASLENAYKNALMVGKFPACVLNIKIPFDMVDVNVHPTKTEVRFSDERRVNSAVYYAAKSAIQIEDTVPEFDLTKLTAKPKEDFSQLVFSSHKTDQNDIETVISEKTEDEKKQFWKKETPSSFFKISDTGIDRGYREREDEPDLIGDMRKYTLKPEPQKNEAVKTEIIPENEAVEDNFRYIGEAFKTYLLCEYNGKLCIIDKHAAHERIIFNKLKAERGEEASQHLLEPITVTLGKAEYDGVLQNKDELEKSGFSVDDFGEGVVAVRQRPLIIDDDEVAETIAGIAENLCDGKIDAYSDKLDIILHTTACKAAIKGGNRNSPAELAALARKVCESDDVRYCPHGRPVIVEMSEYELQKNFRRIVN